MKTQRPDDPRHDEQPAPGLGSGAAGDPAAGGNGSKPLNRAQKFTQENNARIAAAQQASREKRLAAEAMASTFKPQSAAIDPQPVPPDPQPAPIDAATPDDDSLTPAGFLKMLRPGGPWVLTAINPTDENIKTVTAVDADAVRAFVRTYDGKRNLYYSVNPTRAAMTSKAAKTDIAAIEYLLSDLDPRTDETPEAAKTRYLAALATHQPAPNAVVDSGNGIQVLWRLSDPIRLAPPIVMTDGEKLLAPEAAEIIDDVEARVKATMVTLGSAAGTQNIDRILRLPWTTNLPNAKKLRDGRVACPTKLLYFKGHGCALDAFPEPAKKRDAPPVTDAAISTLPVSDRIKELIQGRDDPDHVYASRSERVNAVIYAMTGAGCSDEQIETIFADRTLPISAHVREQSRPQAYLAKHIAKARKATIDPHVAKLNERYALVITGDKNVVMKISPTDKSDLRFLTLTAFEQWFYNRFVTRHTADGDKSIPLGKYWLHHPQRRQYEGLTFSPHCEVPDT